MITFNRMKQDEGISIWELNKKTAVGMEKRYIKKET
jgi:hypothetical protein